MDRATCLKAVDATVGWGVCQLLGALHFLSRPAEPARAVQPGRLRRLLVIRPGGMGDMILLLPVLARLRRDLPSCEIDIVCEKRNLPVLALAGLGDRALAYDGGPVQFLRALRRGYDAVVDTEQFHHFSAVFALLTGASVRIGFNINPRRNALYTHLVSYAPDGPEGDQFGRLLQPLGLGPEPQRLPGVLTACRRDLPPDLEALVRGEGPLVAIHAGSRTAYKRWPADRFAELGRRLALQAGLRVVTVGDRGDLPDTARVTAAMVRHGCPVVSAAGRLDLARTASLLARADLFVGGDSGLAHLAVALDRPAVVLFGPSDPRKWGTRDDRRRVVSDPPPCSPCFLFGYHRPCRSLACIRGINVEEVLQACLGLLGLPSS